MLYGCSFGRDLTGFWLKGKHGEDLVVGKVSLLPSHAILKKIKTDEKEYFASSDPYHDVQCGTEVDTFFDSLRHIFRDFTRSVFRFFAWHIR